MYRTDIPRPSARGLNGVRAECIIPDIGPFPPATVEPENIFINSLSVEALGPTSFRVMVMYSFIFVQRDLEILVESFDIWLDGFEAPVDTNNFAERISRIPPLQRCGTITQNIEVEGDTFEIYLQVHTYVD